jgi:hypothetical protein
MDIPCQRASAVRSGFAAAGSENLENPIKEGFSDNPALVVCTTSLYHFLGPRKSSNLFGRTSTFYPQNVGGSIPDLTPDEVLWNAVNNRDRLSHG